MIRLAKDAAIRLLARHHRRVVYTPPGEAHGLDLVHDLRVIIAKPAPLCLDVGANAGQTIDLLERTFERPRIHAFEPSAAMFDRLQARRFGDRVSLHRLALGRRAERREFRNYDRSDLSSFLRLGSHEANPFRDVGVARTEVVDIETVDRFLSAQAIDSVDLLKIDTQGFDGEVLAGSSGSLAEGRIHAVLVELNLVPLYDGQSSAVDILASLAASGLSLVGLYEVVRQTHAIAWCTALFARAGREAVPATR